MKILLSSSFIIAALFISSCGTGDQPGSGRKGTSRKQTSSEQLIEESIPAQINLTGLRTDASSLESIVEIEYKNTDYISVLRCSSSFILRGPTGKILRHPSGSLQSDSGLELRAAWENALGATTSCRLLGEKVVRASFNDPIAPTGSYFYVFNPCRETIASENRPAQTICSFNLASTEDISIRNTLNERTTAIAQLLTEKEAQLAALALNFRQQMVQSLYAQKSCENNEAVDAVKEARWKALSSVLITGIAASIGGAVAGPQAAVTAAQKTLQWIMENVQAGTNHNSTRCTLLQDAEAKAKDFASQIDSLTKEISQLKSELAHP